MKYEDYQALRARIISAGYAADIVWAQSVKPPETARAFWSEYAWVVLISGMREQGARVSWDRFASALRIDRPVFSAFKHPGKAAAIQRGGDEQEAWFAAYQSAEDKLAYLRALPWIGGITVYHLAKNFGVDCAKPDRHHVRIAGDEGVDAI